MFKSTLFIAVQCCQCSTMQVKQQKKSSNKWNCVICNQKQSVKKIYAEGYQAKEIRQFVQSFNMSRKDADEIAAIECEASSVEHSVEHVEGVRVQDEHKAKKRSDWSEYIENEEDTRPACLKSLPNERHMFEPEIVAEIPERLMLKRAKLKGQVSKKEANNNDLPRNVSGGWQQEEQKSLHQQQSKQMAMGKRRVSKWSEYMEDENHLFRGKKAAFADDFKIKCGDDLETDVMDERVEEDIHPDFF